MQPQNHTTIKKFFQKALHLTAVTALFMACLVTVSMVFAPASASATPPLLVDEQDLLTPDQELKLSMKLAQISDELETDVIIYIPYTLNGQEVAQFSYDYVADNNYGRGDSLSAVVLVICRDGNYLDYTISATGTAQKKLFGSDDKAGDIETKVLNRLKDYKSAGFSGDGIFKACEQYIEGVENGMLGFFARFINVIKTFNFALLLLGFIVSFILAAAYMRIQKGKLISIRSQNTANDYIDGGVQLRISRDRFINQTVSRTKIEREKSSGGGSSMSHGSSGGRSFSSHSGRV